MLCYERADDIGFGVSGVVTRARGIRATLPDLDPAAIPMAAPVTQEKVVYLLDPAGASRRSLALRAADDLIRGTGLHRDLGVELPYIPPFLHKQGGLVMSLGQFMQWVGGEIAGIGRRAGLAGHARGRGADRGRRRHAASACAIRAASPAWTFCANLTVVGDGPVGAVGRQLDEAFGLPDGHHQREWAVGMKMVIDLPEGSTLEPGTVFHTFGYPGARDLRLPLRASRTVSRRPESSCRRGSAPRCGRRTATCSISSCIPICGGI